MAKLTKEQWQQAVLDYKEGLSTAEIGRKYGVTQSSVYGALKRRGVKFRPAKPYKLYSVNHRVFDIITEKAAYWLGFFTADGCVNFPKRGGLPKLVLTLKESDKDHVQAFADFIESTYPLYQDKSRGAWICQVASEELANVFKLYGIVPGKKYLQIEVVDKLAYNRHFWRGMLDGDGWIEKNGNAFELASGSEALLKQFIKFVLSVTPDRQSISGSWFSTNLSVRYNGHGCPRVGTSGGTARRLLEFLYTDASIYLPRKYNRVFFNDDVEANIEQKSKRTTEQDALSWLEENAPHIKLKSWGGAGSKVSTFLNLNTGYEFNDTFIRIKNRIKNGMDVGARRAKKGTSSGVKSTIQKYLKENAPHIELRTCADKISDKSVFYNTETEKEFKFSFSNLKYQLKHGHDVGVGLSEAAKRLNKIRSTKPTKEITELPPVSDIKIYVHEWLNSIDVDFVENKQLKNTSYRPDFFLPENKLIIECDGLYWHSDAVIKDKHYHRSKLETYENLGHKVLFFRSNELLEKTDIVKSIILNSLGCNTNRVYARDCEVVIGNNTFFDNHHLMGSGTGETLALKAPQGHIVAAIQTRWVNKDSRLLDVSRFCSAPGTTVVGGFSRLLAYVGKIRKPNVIQTFIDRRYGLGYYLKDLGFEFQTCYPSFKWTDGINVFHRMRYPGDSGYDQGFYKIWDCGQAKWTKRIKVGT